MPLCFIGVKDCWTTRSKDSSHQDNSPPVQENSSSNQDNSPLVKTTRPNKKIFYTYLIYKYCYYSLIFENQKSSIQFLNFIIKYIVNKTCFKINIIDIYTNETIANKSSLKHYHYWNISHSHMVFDLFRQVLFLTVCCKSAHIPLEVCPRWKFHRCSWVGWCGTEVVL